MSLDFTLHKYKLLLTTCKGNGYTFIAFEDVYKSTLPAKYIILRHDVDDLPLQSLLKAEIEHELSIRSTYYFRIVPESNQPEIIKKIADLGHEIGYHYEDLSLANGDFKKAIQLFENNLNYFRTFYPVKTICMHGSPASVWDNKMLWRDYDYKKYNILGEPYFDIDFSSTLYLTDTGRRWDGNRVSVRDKVKNPFQLSFRFNKTEEIINAVKQNQLPPRIMITTYPQRWHDSAGPWMKELIFQNLKNVIKKYFYVSNPMTD